MAYSQWSGKPRASPAAAGYPAQAKQVPKAAARPAARGTREGEEDEELEKHPYPAHQRSRWLARGAWRLARTTPEAMKLREDFPACQAAPPPEAPFCWSATDYRVFGQSAGQVRPKLDLRFYLSPQCPQTIVDLVKPTFTAQNWRCITTLSPSENPPILIWEGSKKSVDWVPTLELRGLVNRVGPVFRMTTKCGMLDAIRARCSSQRVPYPPPWYPLAFRLPEDLEEWKAHASEHPEKRWIYKPDGGARGIGLILISSVEEVDSPEEPFSERCRPMGPFNPDEPPLAQRYFAPNGIIQEYVQDLLLMDGRKFAVRVYVLIARVKPLLVYLHGASYAKVCGLPFDKGAFSQAELFRHVTNQEFQKKGGQAYPNWKTIPVMTLDEVDEKLSEEWRCEGKPAAEPFSAGFWPQVRTACAEVMESARGRLEERGKFGMFEILGLDFISDANGKVIFLEANRDPSWVVDGPTKRGIIPALVAEMLQLVFTAHGKGHASAPGPDAKQADGGLHFEVIVDDERGFRAT